MGVTGGAIGSPVTWTDYTCQPDNTYYYIVVAADAENNESFASNCVTVAVGPDVTPPNAVVDQQTSQTGGTYNVNISWSDPGDNVNVSEYRIYRLNSYTTLAASDIVPGNYLTTVDDTDFSVDGSADALAYSYTDTTTAFGQDYSYAVVAADAASNVSGVPAGTTFSVSIVDPAPAAVDDLSARPLPVLMEAELTWTPPINIGAISGYNVYRTVGAAVTQSDLVPGNMAAGPIAALTYTDQTLGSTATDYYYAVTAIDDSSGKESALGNVASVNIPEPPSEMDAVRRLDSSVDLAWLPPSVTANLTGYKTYTRREGGAWTYETSVTQPVAAISLYGREPGTYDFSATATYSTYGGSTPYESVLSAGGVIVFADTVKPEPFGVTGYLTSGSNYTDAFVDWNAPADDNYTGFSPAGLDHYRVLVSKDQGASYLTAISSELTNPGFEAHTNTADDANADAFTGWTIANTYAYAVTDSFFDTKAIKIKYDGAGDYYILQAEPSIGQSVAGKSYSLSFWAKADRDTTFQYFIQANGGNYETLGLASPAIDRTWQRFTASGTFSGGATATSARAVIRPSTDTTAGIIIDGVRLEHNTAALSADDGTYYRTAGYSTPGTAQSYAVPDPIDPGTSLKYRVMAVDGEWNISDTAETATIFAKPTPVVDLDVTSMTSESGNELTFSPSQSEAGLSLYNIYALEQGTPLTDLSGATLVGSVTPTVPYGNIALTATATASHVYSTSTSYRASNANDGSGTTSWYGKQSVGPEWLMLDFGSDVMLGHVAFSYYNSSYYRPADYLIQTYDGSGWVTQVAVTGNTSNSPTHVFPSPVLTDKVRIYITKTYNETMSYMPIIYEFMAYGKELFEHTLNNTMLRAEPGHTYAYAVIAEDIYGLTSDISGGPATVRSVVDADAPDKVGDLSLTSPVGTTGVVLTWGTPIDNLGYGIGTGATDYEVYRLPTSSVGTPEAVTDYNFASASLVGTGTYASSTAGTLNNYSTTWYDHLGVYYAVRSADPAGNWSVISNSPYIVTGKDAVAPDAPVITSVVPVGSPDMDVYWNPATDNVGINGYKLYRADVSVEPFATDECVTENNVGLADVAVALIPYDADSTTDSGGTPGSTYYYAMVAWDDEGNVSSISNCAAASVQTTAADSTVPTWPATPLSAIAQPYPDIDLIWDAASDLDDLAAPGVIDHYDIYRNVTSFSSKSDPGVTKIGTVSGVRHSYVDDTGDHDTKYWYGVIAVDASANANESALTNIAAATVGLAPSPDNTPPQLPADLAAATGVYPYMNLSWTASTDVDDAANPKQLMYYRLYRSDYPLDITDGNKDNPALVTTIIMANDAVGYAATGMGSGVYNFRLEAFDTAGNPSGLSAQVVGTVADAPCEDTVAPSAPGSLDATIGPSPDMDLSWTASTDSGGCSGVIDHYRLYRSVNEITVSTDLRTITPVYVAGNSTSVIESSGVPNTHYWYVMTAVDTFGNESVRSNIIERTTAFDNMPPASISDLLATPDAGFMRLTWCRPSDNVGIDHYEIYRKPQAGILTDADIIPANSIGAFVNSGVCLSYDDAGVSAATTYSYAIIAVDSAGNRSTISRGESPGDTVAAMP
jgi:fibronectin type 3 domain-containing protein